MVLPEYLTRHCHLIWYVMTGALFSSHAPPQRERKPILNFVKLSENLPSTLWRITRTKFISNYPNLTQSYFYKLLIRFTTSMIFIKNCSCMNNTYIPYKQQTAQLKHIQNSPNIRIPLSNFQILVTVICPHFTIINSLVILSTKTSQTVSLKKFNLKF